MKIHKTKVWLKLSLSSEITIKLGKSRLYLRFVLILYVTSSALIWNSSLPLIFKLLFTFLITIQFRSDRTHQSPCPGIVEIHIRTGCWSLVTKHGTRRYESVTLLIHNFLFQLIKLSNSERSQYLILFNDQISNEQLRLVYLKMPRN